MCYVSNSGLIGDRGALLIVRLILELYNENLLFLYAAQERVGVMDVGPLTGMSTVY